MRDEQRGELLGEEQLERLVVEVLTRDLVDGAEGLVEQQHGWPQRQGAGQRAAHPHPTRQRLGVVLLEPGQTDHVDRRLGQTRPLGVVDAAQLGEQLDVLLDSPPREQRGVLEHVAEVLAVDLDLPAGRFEQAGGDPQQRRLPAAGRADDRDELTGADTERHVVDGAGAVGERHGDGVEGQPTGARRVQDGSSSQVVAARAGSDVPDCCSVRAVSDGGLPCASGG